LDLRGFNFSASSAKQFVDFSVTAPNVDGKLRLHFKAFNGCCVWVPFFFLGIQQNHHATATLAKDTSVSDVSVEALASVSRFGRGPVGW